MVSLLMMLVFAPILVLFTRMYLSPLPRLDRYNSTKVLLRIVLAVAVLGGLLAQLNFLAHHETPSARRAYLLALLIIEGIPVLIIGFRRGPGRGKPER